MLNMPEAGFGGSCHGTLFLGGSVISKRAPWGTCYVLHCDQQTNSNNDQGERRCELGSFPCIAPIHQNRRIPSSE